MRNVQKETINNLLVSIPAGRVSMRDDRINRAWEVDIEPFYLSKYLVTQHLYQAITGQNPSSFNGDQLPVETVTWLDAVSFCNQLSGQLERRVCYTVHPETRDVLFNPKANGIRLPTEAEWQYACQAGDRHIRYGALDEIAWYKDNSKQCSKEVGKKAPNSWGLYDMLGNVWEWCSDIYDETVYGSYRIFRGGGWCDEERSVMATTRRRSHPRSFAIDDLGFRIAINMPRPSEQD